MRCALPMLVIMSFLAAVPRVAGETQDSFSMDLLKDGVLIGTGVSIFVAGNLLKSNAMPPAAVSDPLAAPAGMVTTNFTKSIDTLSDILQYVSFFTPALLAIDFDAMGIVTTGVMYTESVLLAIGVKDSLKGLFPLYRPYMFGPNPPEELLEDDDRYLSFPSGHTTMAFTGASFFTYVFLTKYPDSKLKIPVIVGSILFANTTAAMRVLSGQHFITDVLAGAVIGATCGLIVPLIHRNKSPGP